jgi:hypothetical protein
MTSALSMNHGDKEEITIEPGNRYYYRLHVGGRFGSTKPGTSALTVYPSQDALISMDEEVSIRLMSKLSFSE